MTHIKPFAAVHYNPEEIKDISKVVSPPYDVISPEAQDYFHKLSPYNFTHIDLGKDKDSDNKENNKYSRAQKTFEQWLKKGIMVQDDEPSVYFYKQEYRVQGQKHTRLGFVSLMPIHDEEDSKVRPHENTHQEAVDDRYKLTKALNSNLSSIFVCYSDKNKQVDKVFAKHVLKHGPIIDINDEDGVHHILWKLSDPDLIQQISHSLEGQNLFIADGHHRFKVACEYRKARLGKKSSSNGQEPFNYVMTYFTNIDSKNLQIFPMHRILKKFDADIEFLDKFFRIDKVKSKEELLILLAKAGRNEHAFGLYTRDGIKLLRLKNKGLIEKYVKEGSKEYKSLDATILKCFVFDEVGIDSSDIMYTKDLSEATKMVDNGQAEASFIMNAVKIKQLKDIALNGEKMPPKTTYFYPKVLSGLTVYKMD